VPVEGGARKLEFGTPPPAHRLVGKIAPFVDIVSLVIVGAVKQTASHIRMGVPRAAIIEVHEGPSILGATAGIVEILLERRCGDAFIAIRVNQFQDPVLERQLAEELVGGIVIETDRDAVVGRWVGEFGKIKVLSLAVVGSRGQQHFQSVVQRAAEGRPAPVSFGAGDRAGDFQAANIPPPFGGDADHAEKGVVAVERRGGAGRQELDPFDQIHVHDEIGVHRRHIVNVVVDPIAIYQEQQMIVVIAGTAKPAHAHAAVAAIVAQVNAGEAPQDVGQGSVALGFDVLGRDHRHRRGCFAGLLPELGSRIHLHLHQFFEAEVREIHRSALGESRATDRQSQDQPQRPEQRAS
jgi:hypothetical protein